MYKLQRQAFRPAAGLLPGVPREKTVASLAKLSLISLEQVEIHVAAREHHAHRAESPPAACRSTAAAETAPLGSTKIFIRVSRNFMVARISSSLTSTICSTFRWMIGKVNSPGVGAQPSAMVRAAGSPRASPAANERNVSLASAGSTPKMRIEGLICFGRFAHPRNQSAAADKRPTRRVGNFFEQFQRDGARPAMIHG